MIKFVHLAVGGATGTVARYVLSGVTYRILGVGFPYGTFAVNLIGCFIRTKGVQGFVNEGRVYDYVITVCDEASAQRCPVFPGGGQRIHMGFEDPSALDGSYEEKFEKIKIIRDQIKASLKRWIREQGDD